MRLREFAPASNPGGGNYLKALASAWYNGTFNTGDLHKGIKSQEDVEKILQRGIHCGDGKIRKYEIGYNSDFDGVVITSDDYYNYSDYDDAGNEVDERTGKPWGPYEYVEFHDNDLDESLNEFAPDSNDGSGEEDILHKYARMWWAGDEATQLKIEAALDRMGWEIGQDEGGYDNGGVFVVRAGDENGNSYISWSAEDLVEAKKKKRKKKSSTSLRGYFFPGYAYYGGDNSGEYGGDGGGDGGGGGESINRGVAEGTIDRRIARTQALIQDYYNRSRNTRNDIKRDHYIDMARQLEYELEGMINDANQAEQDSYNVAQHDAEPSATWNRGGLAEGDVVQFPKKHRGDITDMHTCPKCGSDLQGGKYMGHQVKVCQPCKQVYLPPNSGIDQKGNKIDEPGVAEGS